MATGGIEERVASLSLLRGLSAALTREGRRFVVLTAALTSGVALVSTMVLYDYVSESRFIAVQPSPVASSGSLPSERPLPPSAYAELARSNHILTQLSSTRFDLGRTSDWPAVSGTLTELLDCRDTNPRDELACTVDELSNRVEAWVDVVRRAVHVRVRMDHPRLAESVNSRILELIDDAERDRHRVTGQSARRFSEGRLAVARSELEVAESRVSEFLRTNKSGLSSTRVALERSRLTQEAARRETVYRALYRGSEQGRISEMRATPLLWVMDPPEGSARPHRSVWFNTVLGFCLGLAWAAGVLVAELWVTQSRSSRDYQGMAAAFRGLRFAKRSGGRV